MRTVFRARIKPDGPRRSPWPPICNMMEQTLVGRDLHVVKDLQLRDGTKTYMTVSEEDHLDGWFIHEADLDLFESWVEWPEGAQLVASTYTAERLLPALD
jgi:hypothetical protein